LLLRHYQEWLEGKALRILTPREPGGRAHCARRGARSCRHGEAGAGAVWLDGFSELTPQELELLTEVIALSRRSTLAFCLPGISEDEPRWVSAWSGVTRTFRSVWNRVGDLPVDGTPEVVVLPEGRISRFRFDHPGARAARQPLERAFGAEPAPAVTGDAVRCVVCPDPVGRRPSRRGRSAVCAGGTGPAVPGCGVLLRSFEGYHEVISRVFGRYDIPFFLDRREPVAHHPLAELIRYGMRTVAFGWQHDDWFGALKTGLVPVGEAALDELENEALAHGWSGDDWLRPLRLPENPRSKGALNGRGAGPAAFELFARRLSARMAGTRWRGAGGGAVRALVGPAGGGSARALGIEA
jgi:ATP-dependent helicase/nuclease subunit B